MNATGTFRPFGAAFSFLAMIVIFVRTPFTWLAGHLPTRRNRWRVPVLYQLNAIECGAACLAMVLG